MKRFTRSILMASSLTSALFLSASPSLGIPPVKPYPNNGDLYYDGGIYADSFFKWFNIGGWRQSNPAFEMDMTLIWNYLGKCTTYNNLPLPKYDDYPTGGDLEPDIRYHTYGFGTWNAKSIVNRLTYKAQWKFTLANQFGSAVPPRSTSVKIGWQEVAKKICPFQSIWCMAGVNGSLLMSKASNGTPLALTKGRKAY